MEAINSSMQSIVNAYEDTAKKEEEAEDPLGRDAFLTMLVAQLENQDPLKPMEGTDFTAQLAQFSTLENEQNANATLEKIQQALESQDDQQESLLDYIGKTITADIQGISVRQGQAQEGYFTLASPAEEVAVAVYDNQGLKVRDLYLGGKSAGTHEINWNAENNTGEAVADGDYSFEVVAQSESGGYIPTNTVLEGEVTGVARTPRGDFLQVGQRQLSADKVTKVALTE